MADKPKNGEVVTMVQDRYATSTVVKIKSIGPVNIRYMRIMKEGDPEWWRHEVFIVPRENVSALIRGAHPELRDALRKATQEYETAYREHDSTRRSAAWDAQTKWDEENPRPASPVPGEIMGGLGLCENLLAI